MDRDELETLIAKCDIDIASLRRDLQRYEDAENSVEASKARTNIQAMGKTRADLSEALARLGSPSSER